MTSLFPLQTKNLVRDAGVVGFIPNIGGDIVAVYVAAAFRQGGCDIVAFSLAFPHAE